MGTLRSVVGTRSCWRWPQRAGGVGLQHRHLRPGGRAGGAVLRVRLRKGAGDDPDGHVRSRRARRLRHRARDRRRSGAGRAGERRGRAGLRRREPALLRAGGGACRAAHGRAGGRPGARGDLVRSLRGYRVHGARQLADVRDSQHRHLRRAGRQPARDRSRAWRWWGRRRPSPPGRRSPASST